MCVRVFFSFWNYMYCLGVLWFQSPLQNGIYTQNLQRIISAISFPYFPSLWKQTSVLRRSLTPLCRCNSPPTTTPSRWLPESSPLKRPRRAPSMVWHHPHSSRKCSNTPRGRRRRAGRTRRGRCWGDWSITTSCLLTCCRRRVSKPLGEVRLV